MDPNHKNKIIIDEETAPIVRRIFDMALTGMSCRQIAVQLNAEEIPTPASYAGMWSSMPGRKLLRQRYEEELSQSREDIGENAEIFNSNLNNVSIRYRNLGGNTLEFSYNGARVKNGAEQFVLPYPLIETPFASSEIGSGILKIKYRGEGLTLDGTQRRTFGSRG